jgi:hypothetical protein
MYQRPARNSRLVTLIRTGGFEPAPPQSALFRNCGHIDQGWTHLYFELPQTVGFTFGLLASINGAEGSSESYGSSRREAND